MEQAITIIQTVGFPIAVAIYLLWKDDKRTQILVEYAKANDERAKTMLDTNEKALDLMQQMELNQRILLDRIKVVDA